MDTPDPGGPAAPHRIRLGPPWEVAADGPGAKHTRRFGRPWTLAPGERVWLVCERLPGAADITLNGGLLGTTPATGPFAADITESLSARNTLTVAVPSDGCLGDVALEIRAGCSRFTRA